MMLALRAENAVLPSRAVHVNSASGASLLRSPLSRRGRVYAGRALRARAAAQSPADDAEDLSDSPVERIGERAKGDVSHSTDVVIVGGGIAGLCCAGVLAYQGKKVTVCEAHTIAGGAAHSFERKGYVFDSGPSFFFDLSCAPGKSKNPLKQVLDLLGEPLECATYDRWTVYTPEGKFPATTVKEDYYSTIQRFAGDEGLAQWKALEARLRPVGKMADAIPFAALRNDPGAALTMARKKYWLGFHMSRYMGQIGPAFLELAISAGGPGGAGDALSGSLGKVMESAGVTNKWLRQLLDLECFVISGCLVDGTPSPEMGFMYKERHRPGAILDFPIGGSQSFIDALVRGIQKHGGRVLLGAPVEQVVMEGGRATGVRLAGGKGTIRASGGVVCSTSVWDRLNILPASVDAKPERDLAQSAPECASFVHLHVGFDATGLDLPAIGIHHLAVRDFMGKRMDADRNVVNICIPSALDKTMAPPGKASAHVYYAANEPFDDWKGLKRGSPEYEALKRERAEPLWEALSAVIPDVRKRTEVELIASPLTHARFLRRHRGSYGPALPPGAWPGPVSSVPGLFLCGDSVFPGIGVPAAAASGVIAANAMLPIWKHVELLDALDAGARGEQMGKQVAASAR